MSESRGRRAGSRAVSVATLLALVIVPACSADADRAVAQDWRTVTSMRRTSGEDELRVDVEYGVGELSITPASGDMLYRARLRYDANAFEPQMSYEDGSLLLGIDGDSGVHMSGHEAGELAIELGPSVPLVLDLKFGAVEATMELGGLQIRSADVATGASETTIQFSEPNPIRMDELDIDAGAASLEVHGLGNANVERVSFDGGMADVLLDFSGAWQANATAEVTMGVGSVTIRVPRDIGVRIQKSSLFASFDADGFTQQGSSYFSANWDEATYQLDVDIESALGSIEIDWIEPVAAATPEA